MYMTSANQCGKTTDFQALADEVKRLQKEKMVAYQKDLSDAFRYAMPKLPVAPLYEKKIKYEPATDRPTLAQRLDAMEEKYKKECAFKRQLEHDCKILQDNYDNMVGTYVKLEGKYAAACNRLKSLDLMGSDLQKLRTAIGAKAYNDILNAKEEGDGNAF